MYLFRFCFIQLVNKKNHLNQESGPIKSIPILSQILEIGIDFNEEHVVLIFGICLKKYQITITKISIATNKNSSYTKKTKEKSLMKKFALTYFSTFFTSIYKGIYILIHVMPVICLTTFSLVLSLPKWQPPIKSQWIYSIICCCILESTINFLLT